MDAFLTEVAKQVPSLGVLCFIVWVFINHLDKRDKTLKEMHQEHIDERAISRETIRDNTLAMRQNTNAISELKEVIQSKLTSNGKV